MADDDNLRQTLQPIAPGTSRREYEASYTEQNTDGSTVRQERMFRNVGVDYTPTFSVAAEFDEIVRVVAFNFPAGVAAQLQFVIGCHSGEEFSDVVHEGVPVVVSADDTIITIPFSGRYRFLFKDGWPAGARVGVIRQERIPAEDFGFAGALDWQSTGEFQCRYDGLYEKQLNQHNRLRWVRVADTCLWVPTGERQCRTDHREWQRERNRAGDYRWVQTATVCGYDPTYPLPCGGWAFGPGDERDPEASLELTDCVTGEGQGIWVYPAPGPGHTVPLRDCLTDRYCAEGEDIEGWGANCTLTGVRDICYDNEADRVVLMNSDPGVDTDYAAIYRGDLP